jgi:hypothetical protein
MDDQRKMMLFRWFFTGRQGLFAKRLLGDDGQYRYKPIYSELTDDHIKAHMRGRVMLGSYPIFSDDTTHWAAADFDGHNGVAFEHARIFADALRAYGIEPLCNTSQSGRGVHVRVIFSDPRYPGRGASAVGGIERPVHAAIARRFMQKVVEQTGLPGFRNGGAFDRVFPTQDYLRTAGSVGSQIAMPFNVEAAQQRGGSMLLDRDFNPIPLKDSWSFMQEYKLVRLFDLVDAVETMGETSYILECVDSRNNFIAEARFDGANRGSVYHQNKKSKCTGEQLEFMLRACDFLRWTKQTTNMPYPLWFALVSQLIIYDAIGGREVFHMISSMDKSHDNRGKPRYSQEKTDRQYDQALATLRSPYSCRRIAADGWQCPWLSDSGCRKFTREDGRGAYAPARIALFRDRRGGQGQAVRADQADGVSDHA